MMMMKKDPKKIASIIIEMGNGEGSKGPYSMEDNGVSNPPPPGALFAIETLLKAISEKDAMKVHRALCDWKDIISNDYDD